MKRAKNHALPLCRKSGGRLSPLDICHVFDEHGKLIDTVLVIDVSQSDPKYYLPVWTYSTKYGACTHPKTCSYELVNNMHVVNSILLGVHAAKLATLPAGLLD